MSGQRETLGRFVTQEACGEMSRRVLEKLESIEKRLFRDNGTLSIQTRIDRHEQILRDWFRDCDGCTAVSEVYWPTIYFPPCLRHDFDWFTGHGGWESNARFYRLQRAYGMERIRAAVRWTGVTVAWYGAYKWWHLAHGNVAGVTAPAAGP